MSVSVVGLKQGSKVFSFSLPAKSNVPRRQATSTRCTAGLKLGSSDGLRSSCLSPLSSSSRRDGFKCYAGGKETSNASTRETVIPEPSLGVPLGLFGISGLAAAAHAIPLSGFCLLASFFLYFQSNRVQFVFDDEALEVIVEGQEEQPENAFVGGRNRWTYDSFVNWEFWWPGFPVLVYFKEVQTKPEGQIHFFPIIMNGKQLYDVMVERCGPSQNSLPE